MEKRLRNVSEFVVMVLKYMIGILSILSMVPSTNLLGRMLGPTNPIATKPTDYIHFRLDAATL